MRKVLYIIKRKATIFWKVPIRYKMLFVVNYVLCGIARAVILTVPLRRLTPYLGEFNHHLKISALISEKQYQQALWIGRTIRMAANYTPWNSNCLTQAIVAAFWCKRFKIPYVFYIGVAKSEEEKSGYIAHAWITAGPLALTGGHGLPSYNVISTYLPLYALNVKIDTL